jgi:lysophospholipase L1-like esterase
VLPFVPLAVLLDQDVPKHVATIPAPQAGQPWWDERHRAKVSETKRGGIDIAFIGDSITQGWDDTGKLAWDRDFAPLRSANFGFSGDRTEHVLWRLENGEVLGLKLKAIVIMLGTNNLGHGVSNPDQTADGIRAIVQKLKKGCPEAKILLLGIFPRGLTPNDSMREAVVQATERYRGLHDGERVFFSDLARHFVRIDGTLRTTLMPDLLHLTRDGYEIWAKALLPELKSLTVKAS